MDGALFGYIPSLMSRRIMHICGVWTGMDTDPPQRPIAVGFFKGDDTHFHTLLLGFYLSIMMHCHATK